jgi:Family of unknown function (DUF5681)
MAHDTEYEVGYKKPPKASQFQKGRSGNPSGRSRKDPGIPGLIAKIAKQKVLVNGKNGPKYMTKLEAIFTQLANKGTIGDLKAGKLFIEMLTRFSEGIKREDMEAMASSAKAKLLALVEARDDSSAEGAAERDQPPGQANAILHECARTEDLVRRPVEGDGDFGLLGENRSARPTDMNSTSHLPPASPVPDAGGDSPP